MWWPLTVMHVKSSWAVRGSLLLFTATGQALIINFHNSSRNPRIHIHILKEPQRINLIHYLHFQPSLAEWIQLWFHTKLHLSLNSIALVVSVFAGFFRQLPFKRGQPFGLQMIKLTSRVSCHRTCHQTVWGLKDVKGYKISSLNKLAPAKGHRHLSAPKSNYRTGLSMEYKTSCTALKLYVLHLKGLLPWEVVCSLNRNTNNVVVFL